MILELIKNQLNVPIPQTSHPPAKTPHKKQCNIECAEGQQRVKKLDQEVKKLGERIMRRMIWAIKKHHMKKLKKKHT